MKLLPLPAVYIIRARGRIPETWKDAFGDLEIQVDENGPITTLTGSIVDQTALQGVLQNLYTLGLALVGVSCVDNPDEKPENQTNLPEENLK